MAGETALSFQVLQACDGTATEQGSSGWIEALRMHIRHTTVRNALQHRHLKALLAACERKAIPVLLTKGLWLVHCVYRNAAARDSGDIDLLFHPEDMARFTEVARELGYEVPGDGASLSAGAHSTNEFALRHPDCGLLVDVHWSLTNPVTETPVDEGLLWERSELVDIAGVPCRTPNLEDHLLYLCFHAAMHHKFWAVGPRCLYDVA
ncbi:MAG: nucleotidyltransferase family protein, partial [Gammaproteobacteria bacterium]|nr:nucleotidyltransferase family protein [Gammaproteobacteria bacterium]